jgi:DNA-binding beta-propeller fold protein YncE
MLWLALCAAVSVPLASAAPPRAIPVSDGPCGVAVGFGYIWVASDRAGTLSRVDPRTNRVRTVRVGTTACWLTAGAGGIWVARYGPGVLVRVDPKTLRKSTIKVGPNPEGVAVAAGSVWVTGFDDGTLRRVDPVRRKVVETLHLGGVTAGLAVASRSLWIGFGREATAIARLDLRTHELTRIDVGHQTPDRISTDGRSLWVSAQDTVVRVDPQTNRVVARFALGGTFAQGTSAGDGAIWIPNKERNTITRFDPRTNRVAAVLRAGPGAIAATAGFGTVWVTSYAGADIRRYRVR